MLLTPGSNQEAKEEALHQGQAGTTCFMYLKFKCKCDFLSHVSKWVVKCACLGVKNIGKPCALIAHARFDEGGQVKTCSLLYTVLSNILIIFNKILFLQRARFARLFDGVAMLFAVNALIWRIGDPKRKGKRS